MFGVTTIIVAVLAVLYIGYLVFEYFYYSHLRKKIKLVVHVNGTRGKSTTTRLIAAGLRGCGLKVFSKTTGTIPTTIGVDNTSKEIKRFGPPNIREQLKMVALAAKEGADVLVIECMAVNPELQYICERRILKSNICVITNVRPDHLDVMGDSLESIAKSLANTTPINGTLVLGEDNFTSVFKECAVVSNSKLVVARPYNGDSLDTFPENIATALAVCDVLGLPQNDFKDGMRQYEKDPGALKVVKKGDTVFVNAFSVNDPDSTIKVYDRISKEFDPSKITVVINTRADRAFRIDQHVEMLRKMTFKNVALVGSYKSHISSKLESLGINCYQVKDLSQLLNEEIIFGCGNIKGDGMKIIDYFYKGDNNG